MIDINELLGRISYPETPEERDEAWSEVADRLRLMDAMRTELNVLCDWGDESFMHAYAHIGNVVKNLRADVRTERILREKAEANYAFKLKRVKVLEAAIKEALGSEDSTVADDILRAALEAAP